MPFGRIETTFRAGSIAAATLAFSLAITGDARADVSPTGKGTVGGALLGGEVVTITMGAVGVNRGWPYLVFGPLGMIGGGVAGYFVEKGTSPTVAAGTTTGTGGTPEPALFMLAGGMALVIPALIISLNATAYKPPEGDRVEPANNEPTRDMPKATPSMSPAATTLRPSKKAFQFAAIPHIPVSLLDFYKGKFALGLPAVELRPTYSQQEMWKFGVAQGTEVKFPLFKAMF